jgi:hypothetical protein
LDALDEVPVSSMVVIWSPYYAASNDAARLRDIASSMTNGECVDVKLRIRCGGEALQLTTKRLPAKDMTAISYTHDLPGDTFRLLSEDVAYLKLSSAKTGDVDHYLEAASKTKGLIIDIRNYPSEFMVFALGSHFVEKPTALPDLRMAICQTRAPSTGLHQKCCRLQSLTTLAKSSYS